MRAPGLGKPGVFFDSFGCVSFSLIAQRCRHSDCPRLRSSHVFFTLSRIPPTLVGDGVRKGVIREARHDFGASQTGETDHAAFILIIQIDAAVLVNIDPHFGLQSQCPADRQRGLQRAQHWAAIQFGDRKSRFPFAASVGCID